MLTELCAPTEPTGEAAPTAPEEVALTEPTDTALAVPIQLRRYTAEDYPIIAGWFRARGIEPIAPDALTDYGVFATLGGVEIACAWFAINNRSTVARMEHFIEAPGESYPEAEMHLVQFFMNEAERYGKAFEIDDPFAGSGLIVPRIYDDAFFDECWRRMQGGRAITFEMVHRHTPGMYIRQITMPAGSLVLSHTHTTEHPFTISMGDISVAYRGIGATRYKAPYTGITKPGTRRLLYAHETTIWTTYHVTDETDIAKIEESLREPFTLTLKGAV